MIKMIDWSNQPENRLSVALKFGMAVKMSGQWTYVITKQKFEEVTGIKVL